MRGNLALKNAKIMFLLVHALDTASDLNKVLEKNCSKCGENGLCGEDGLKVNMMAERPWPRSCWATSLVSVRSNDLIQLTLGLGRDSGLAAHYFVVRNPAIMKRLESVLKAARAKGKYVEICKDHLDLARWPMDQGIDSHSLLPDLAVPE